MLRKSTLLFCSVFLLFIGLNTPSYAGHKAGHNPGGGGGGGGGGGPTPAEIIFHDNLDDKIQGDGVSYLDGDLDVKIGSAATKGNPFLEWWTGSFMHPSTGRTLFLDFGDCASGPCTPPAFVAGGGDVRAAFKVDVNGSVNKGVYGLKNPGDTTVSGMILQFQPTGPDVPPEEKWILVFGGGSNLCPGGDQVHVTKDAAPDTWIVEAGHNGAGELGCLVQNTGPQAEPVGIFRMPFQFTVTTDLP